MGTQWTTWVEKYQTTPKAPAMPGNGFWKSLENVVAAKAAAIAPQERTLETIAQLDKQNVSDFQICKIYGFTDSGMPDGRPNLRMLQEERANPGTHTDRARGWLPPWERKRIGDQDRQGEIMARIHAQQESKMRVLTAVAPEPIEDLLLLDGISGKQICKMKKITRDDLSAYCRDHGLTLPTWDSLPANAIQGVHDAGEDVPRPKAESEPDRPFRPEVAPEGDEEDLPVDDAPAGPLTLEQEVIVYHKQGFSATEISEAVSTPDNEVSDQKVTAIVRRYKKNPEAFETAATAGA